MSEGRTLGAEIVEFVGALKFLPEKSGSFGFRTLGKQYEVIAGTVKICGLGEEYTATHGHHDRGDECLSVMLSNELA